MKLWTEESPLPKPARKSRQGGRRFQVQLSHADEQAMRALAKVQGMPLHQWVRMKLLLGKYEDMDWLGFSYEDLSGDCHPDRWAEAQERVELLRRVEVHPGRRLGHN